MARARDIIATEEFDQAMRNRSTDPRAADRERLRVETDGMLSPKEKRGIGNLIARTVGWVLEKAGLA